MSDAPILIAGPTASGKSALALALARALGGVIVNADSQQVYAEWRVLTARPSAADEAAVPHRLYGHVGVAEGYSAGRWLDEAGAILAACGFAPAAAASAATSASTPRRPLPLQGRGFAPSSPAAPPSPARGGAGGGVAPVRNGPRHAPAGPPARRSPPGASPSASEGDRGGGFEDRGRDPERRRSPSPARGGVGGLDDLRGLRPIIVGGTGLYFRALTRGLAPIPPIPPEIRADGEALLARAGLAHVAADLARRDPVTAAALDLANPRRVLRAREVLEATGAGLAAWQARTGPPLVPLGQAIAVALVPERAALHARSDARLDAMLAEGALDEVARVMALGVPRRAPAMKAVGAAELAAHLAGDLPLAEAVARAKTATRRYARRQLTWIRNQMPDWVTLDRPDPDRVLALAARMPHPPSRPGV